MSNGFGPFLKDLYSIRYRHPILDEDREYGFRSSWTSFENYIEIDGLDSGRPAGPWGSIELDGNEGRVILPHDVAVKIAAAILLSETRATVYPECRGVFNIVDRDTLEAFEAALKAILADDIARTAAEDESSYCELQPGETPF